MWKGSKTIRKAFQLTDNKLDALPRQAGTEMCQANMPGHWLDGSPTPEERQARLAALRRLAYRDWHGCTVYPGPETVALIKRWPMGER